MSLSEYKTKQARFLYLKAQLVMYAHTLGYCLVEYEGCVMPDRKTSTGRSVRDGVHMRNSLHYDRMASDFVLYDVTSGRPVNNGSDSRWEKLGQFWKSLDPLARWGGDFNDANHFSLSHGGRS
jgi:hypothetical protein